MPVLKSTPFYELILARDCTRNCPFCYCERKGSIATEDEIRTFFRLAHEEAGGPFRYVLFGGEPTLNPKGIELAIRLGEELGCSGGMVTNGDNLCLVDPKLLRLLDTVTVSAYDFKSPIGTERYKDIRNLVPRSVFTFSITIHDIGVLEDPSFDLRTFMYFCHHNNARCKIALSHDPKSWRNTTPERLEHLAKRMYKHFLVETMRYGNISIRDSTDAIYGWFYKDFARYFMSELGLVGEGTCLGGFKRTFMDGKFVGECQRFDGKIPPRVEELTGCMGCRWKFVCRRSCLAEVVGGKVDPRLCAIQKGKFEAFREAMDTMGPYNFLKETKMDKNTNGKMVSAILHLREASENLKGLDSRTSMTILELASALAETYVVPNDDIEEMSILADKLTEEA